MKKRAAVLLALFPLAIFAACTTETSSSSTGGNPGTDAASDATSFPDVGKADTGSNNDSGTGPKNYDECVAVCDKQHPAGKVKSLKIDTCWEAKCAVSCVGTDGGADLPGADGGKCATSVETGDAPCDSCTNRNCCTEWDGCFQDKDCSDYDTCLGDCDTEFPG